MRRAQHAMGKRARRSLPQNGGLLKLDRFGRRAGS